MTPTCESIFEAAVRAPDHGKLRPWRFFVVRGDARRRLSELFVAGVKRREPGATEAQIEKEREKPLRAPVTIAVVAKIVARATRFPRSSRRFPPRPRQ